MLEWNSLINIKSPHYAMPVIESTVDGPSPLSLSMITMEADNTREQTISSGPETPEQKQCKSMF